MSTHNHSHGHGHHHHHANPTGKLEKAFKAGVALNVVYIIIEAGIGFYTGSLALLADAGHNLSDVLGLLIAWGALLLTKKRSTAKRTYGYKRSSILAALANAVILLITVGAILVEAIRRFTEPIEVPGDLIIWVAGIGVIVNAATALFFFRDQHHDINAKGAYLHMVADAAISLGVVVAGIVIQTTGFAMIDSLVSIVIVIVITIGTWGLLKDSLNLALDAVPEGVNYAAVEQYLKSLPGVISMHDLHIWALSTTETALTVHLLIPEGIEGDEFLNSAAAELHERFGICHTTIQAEKGDTGQSCVLDTRHTC